MASPGYFGGAVTAPNCSTTVTVPVSLEAGANGTNSYSVRLRPDISCARRDGRLDLFEAKLKVDFGSVIDANYRDDPA